MIKRNIIENNSEQHHGISSDNHFSDTAAENKKDKRHEHKEHQEENKEIESKRSETIMKNNLNSILSSIAIVFAVIIVTTVNLYAEPIVIDIDQVETNSRILSVNDIDVIENTDLSRVIVRNEIGISRADDVVSDVVLEKVQIAQIVPRVEDVSAISRVILIDTGKLEISRSVESIVDINQIDDLVDVKLIT